MERLLEARAPQRRISLGLDRIHAALNYFGRPDRRYPAVIVSGTKGKGSTSAFIAHSFRALGQKTGLYTSPHLQCIGERLTLNGQMISPDQLRGLIGETLRAVDAGKIPELSYFEILTVVAARYFAEQGADFVVWEVGIGGRLDATNAFARVAAVTTSVSLDHADILGPTLRQVLCEKLAIHEATDLRIIGAQTFAVRRVLPDLLPPDSYWLYGRDFSAVPHSLNATGSAFTYWGGLQSHNAKVSQPGDFQIENAATALALVQRLHGGKIPPAVIRNLSSAFWPGRMEIVRRGSSLIVLDGAHNPFSIFVLVRNLRHLFPGIRWNVLFASQTTKNYPRMIQTLSPIAREFIFTVAPGALRPAEPQNLAAYASGSRVLSFQEATALLHLCPASLSPRSIAEMHMVNGQRSGRGGERSGATASKPAPYRLSGLRQDSAGISLSASSLSPVLVTGSLYLVGAVRSALGLAPLTPDQ